MSDAPLPAGRSVGMSGSPPPIVYAAGLARAHHEGFGALAEAAAETAVAFLRRHGHDHGLVVDLGCGSGITAGLLTVAGYDVLGIDISPTMVELARRHAPAARFAVGSLHDATIPAGAVGVLAIGEAVNYAFDPRAGSAGLEHLAGRVAASLAPGGLFLLDVAGPGRAAQPMTGWTDTPSWTVCFAAQEAGGRLTRRIVTFIRDGDHYRREDETHMLALIEPTTVEAALHGNGLQAHRLDGYGTHHLAEGWTAWAATKPG